MQRVCIMLSSLDTSDTPHLVQVDLIKLSIIYNASMITAVHAAFIHYPQTPEPAVFLDSGL